MLAFLLFLAWIVGGSLVRGLVFVKLWDWFLVPNLGAPTIGVAQALGVALLIGILTDHSTNPALKENPESSATMLMAKALMESICYSLMILILGAIYHGFM